MQRNRAAEKLKNPRLLQISFKTMRHIKGTLEYHKTKDILHVMQVLGHKNIKNTLVYTHLAEELFKGEKEFVSRVARNEKDACAFIDAGFDFVCDWNGHKIFRKQKY
jgi:integrase